MSSDPLQMAPEPERTNACVILRVFAGFPTRLVFSAFRFVALVNFAGFESHRSQFVAFLMAGMSEPLGTRIAWAVRLAFDHNSNARQRRLDNQEKLGVRRSGVCGCGEVQSHKIGKCLEGKEMLTVSPKRVEVRGLVSCAGFRQDGRWTTLVCHSTMRCTKLQGSPSMDFHRPGISTEAHL